MSYVAQSDWVSDRVKGAVFLPVGLCIVAASLMMARDRAHLTEVSETAPGIVVEESAGPHHVAVRFTPRHGPPVIYQQNGAVTAHTGDRMVVRYDPADPAGSATFDRFGALWGGVLGVGGLGSAFTMAGAFMLFRRSSSKASELAVG